MTREFVTLPSFDVKWKDLGLDEDDKCRLEQELLENPKVPAESARCVSPSGIVGKAVPPA